MWLFTTKGFISAVAHIDKPNTMIVRARTRQHLKEVCPGAYITTSKDADYHFRTEMSKDRFAQIVDNAIREIDYPNFKNTIRDKKYHDAALNVWWDMRRLQDEPAKEKMR